MWYNDPQRPISYNDYENLGSSVYVINELYNVYCLSLLFSTKRLALDNRSSNYYYNTPLLAKVIAIA